MWNTRARKSLEKASNSRQPTAREHVSLKSCFRLGSDHSIESSSRSTMTNMNQQKTTRDQRRSRSGENRSMGSRSGSRRSLGLSSGKSADALSAAELSRHSLRSSASSGSPLRSSASSGSQSTRTSGRNSQGGRASPQSGSLSRSSHSQSHSQPVKAVWFSEIHIRHYERVVGDNPSCSAGPPIG
jgi:hypothetical protein